MICTRSEAVVSSFGKLRPNFIKQIEVKNRFSDKEPL